MIKEITFEHSERISQLKANFPSLRIKGIGKYSAYATLPKNQLNQFAHYCFEHKIYPDLSDIAGYKTDEVNLVISW